MTYGERLRELRAERRLSLRQVEERGGPNKDTMSLIERDVHRPHPQTLGRIAGALDISVPELRAELEAGSLPLAQAPPSPEQPSFSGLLEEKRREDINEVVLEAARQQLKADTQAKNRAIESERSQSYFMHHDNALAIRLLQYPQAELAGALIELGRRYVEVEQEKELQSAALLKQLEDLAGRA